jgi:hypothetical protein
MNERTIRRPVRREARYGRSSRDVKSQTGVSAGGAQLVTDCDGDW